VFVNVFFKESELASSEVKEIFRLLMPTWSTTCHHLDAWRSFAAWSSPTGATISCRVSSPPWTDLVRISRTTWSSTTSPRTCSSRLDQELKLSLLLKPLTFLTWYF